MRKKRSLFGQNVDFAVCTFLQVSPAFTVMRSADSPETINTVCTTGRCFSRLPTLLIQTG